MAAGESAEIKLIKCGGKQEKRGELTGTVNDSRGHTAYTISGSYMGSVRPLCLQLPLHSCALLLGQKVTPLLLPCWLVQPGNIQRRLLPQA